VTLPSVTGGIGGAASGATIGSMIAPGPGTVVGGIVGGVAGLFSGGGGKKMDYGKILRDYQNYRPKGWWNPEDEAAIGLTRSRLAETATESGRGARLLAKRRMEGRGLAGSPAQEATYARIAEGTAAGRQKAGESAQGQKYNILLGRENMDWNRATNIFNAQMGRAQQQDYLNQSQQSSFWNSMMGLAGDAMYAFGDPGEATIRGSDFGPVKGTPAPEPPIT
jgi:hypothetical protein